MPRISAGLLMYRDDCGGLEVLLVHPGGPLWARKDLGSWSIPKGEPGPGEDRLHAAVREFGEETGCTAAGEFLELAPVKQTGGKIVYAWAIEGDCNAGAIRSNTFSLEWPPKSGRQAEFPEVDRAGWFPLDEARRRILPAQASLLDQLARRVTRA